MSNDTTPATPNTPTPNEINMSRNILDPFHQTRLWYGEFGNYGWRVYLHTSSGKLYWLRGANPKEAQSTYKNLYHLLQLGFPLRASSCSLAPEDAALTKDGFVGVQLEDFPWVHDTRRLGAKDQATEGPAITDF